MHEPEPKTIDEVIADLRREEEKRAEDVRALIKTVHAGAPTLFIEFSRFRPKHSSIRRSPGAIAKFSLDGHIGWYREGQIRGRPNRRMPLQRDLVEARERYFQTLRESEPRNITNAILSRRSAIAREGNGLAPRICAQYGVLLSLGIQRSQRVHKIAVALKCNPDYIRRVLRKHGTRLGPKRNK